MNKQVLHFSWIIGLVGFLAACGNSNSTTAPGTDNLKKDSIAIENTAEEIKREPSKYDELLEKFKSISFDTLLVEYHYDTKEKRFLGRELTLKEAKSLNIEYVDHYYGKLSGVYACYQFPLDSVRIGLIARIPGEYDANSMGLFIFDRKKDQFLKEYMHLSVDFGDAGDVYKRTSWLIRAKNDQYQSLVYDYSAYYHEVDDTSDHTVEEWKKYYLFNCMSSKFDTISKNEVQLKKRFKRVLKTAE